MKPEDVLDRYRALAEKVDAFFGAAAERSAGGITCHAGCAACCEVDLTVGVLEGAAISAFLAQTPSVAAALSSEVRASDDRRCAMLGADGACRIYAVRPLVCRSQGLALRYPPGALPPDAVRLPLADGEATACPLNYTAGMPPPEDALDAERLDLVLATLTAAYAAATGTERLARTSLRTLARGAVRTGA